MHTYYNLIDFVDSKSFKKYQLAIECINTVTNNLWIYEGVKILMITVMHYKIIKIKEEHQ